MKIGSIPTLPFRPRRIFAKPFPIPVSLVLSWTLWSYVHRAWQLRFHRPSDRPEQPPSHSRNLHTLLQPADEKAPWQSGKPSGASHLLVLPMILKVKMSLYHFQWMMLIHEEIRRGISLADQGRRAQLQSFPWRMLRSCGGGGLCHLWCSWHSAASGKTSSPDLGCWRAGFWFPPIADISQSLVLHSKTL